MIGLGQGVFADPFFRTLMIFPDKSIDWFPDGFSQIELHGFRSDPIWSDCFSLCRTLCILTYSTSGINILHVEYDLEVFLC